MTTFTKTKATPVKKVASKAATSKAKVPPIKAMKEVVEKKVSKKAIEQATKSVTTHQEHLDIAKLAYQHLHEEPTKETPVKEESYAKPTTKITEKTHTVEYAPSIPVHSVAIAPKGATEPDPYTKATASLPPTTVAPLPTTKEGKLKWSDIKARLPTQR